MGDIEIANQLIDGVKSALAAVGDTATLSIFPDSVIDINNPGANPSPTPDVVMIEAFLYDFDEQYMPGSSAEQGALLGIIDVSTLTETQVGAISIGNYLSDGSTTYTINNTNPIFVAGKIVTIIIQLGV